MQIMEGLFQFTLCQAKRFFARAYICSLRLCKAKAYQLRMVVTLVYLLFVSISVYYFYPFLHQLSDSQHGGVSGCLTTFVCYPIGYHQILLVNDILESDRMKKQGDSKTKIFSYRMKRLYAGFGRAGTYSFVYRSFHLGLYDNLKQYTSSLSQRCFLALVSTQIANMFSLLIQKAPDSCIIDNLKKLCLKNLFESIFSFRAFSRSTSFIFYLLFK